MSVKNTLTNCSIDARATCDSKGDLQWDICYFVYHSGTLNSMIRDGVKAAIYHVHSIFGKEYFCSWIVLAHIVDIVENMVETPPVNTILKFGNVYSFVNGSIRK